MPWVIERAGNWHSAGGWRTDLAKAKRYVSADDAHDDRNELNNQTLAGLPGEIHVKEVPE